MAFFNTTIMGPNALEYILKLQDMLTPSMRQAVSAGDSAASKIKSQFTGIEYSGKKMGASVNELRTRLESINQIRFGTHIKKEFEAATSSAKVLERQISRMTGDGKGNGLGSLIGGMAAGYGIGSLGKSAITAGAEREQQKISFGVMTGSPEAGNKMLSDLVSMGAKTPYESADLIKNAQTLKAFGIENQNVLPILKTIGDVAAGNKEKLGSLSLAFAQVSSAGKLSGQDLLQMVNAGFNPLQQMVKDKVFPSMQLARKAMEGGAIGANMVEAAFKSATGPGGQFHQMMEKQSQTLAGRYSTFMDNVHEKILRLGESLMPAAGALLTFGSAMLEGEPWAVALAAAIGLVTLSITWASIQTTIYAGITRSAAFFTGLWSGAQAILNATFWANPITWVIASIIALIAIIGYVIYTTDGWAKQWDSIVKFFKFSWESFKDYFHLLWLNMQDSFMTGLEVIERGWYHLKSLWDEDGANAGLAKINAQQNTRAAEIAAAKGVLQKDLASAQNSLTWELHSNGKGLDTFSADIKKKLGFTSAKAVDPTTLNASGSKVDYGKIGGGGLGDAAKGKADGINSGGQRSIVINIGKQIEKLEQHIIGGSREVADEIEGAVRESLRRAVFSLNSKVS